MKHIVLYTIIILSGLLISSIEISGQKTSIDLLPSARQTIHKETLADTSFSNDSLVRMVPEVQSSHLIVKQREKRRFFRKEKSTSESRMDSLIQRKDDKSKQLEKKTANTVLLLKSFNPIRFIIYITALNI